MKLIAVLCDAGPDVTGMERKTTLMIDQEGCIHGARIGWPEASNSDFHQGPILRVTGEEYLFQCQIATGTGV